MITPPLDYECFELLVGSATDDGYPVTVIESPAGETQIPVFATLNVEKQELQYGLEMLERGNPDAELLTALGCELFRQLFIGEIATLFRSSLAMQRGQNRHLRLRLRIEPIELYSLPWELLYDPAEQLFLAIAADIALVRHFPQRIPVRLTAVQHPLRLLVAIAMPNEVVALDVEREKELIQQALGDSVKAAKVIVEFLEHATPALLMEALRKFQPHVFHFIGHGFVEKGRAYAVLEDEIGDAVFVDEVNFREIFASSKDTRLVVLNACQSATPVESRSLTGLAPALLQRQLSAVVAMQYPIRDTSALVFSRHFYHSLSAGFPVDIAIAEARRSIFVEIGADCPDWAAPVLYLRSRNGQLFTLSTPTRIHSFEIPAPPEPTILPLTPDFVGREVELTHYQTRLLESGIAVVVGMPGIGKSALAAQLAANFVKTTKVFWHSCHANEGADVLIWKLAGFLAWQGQPAVWEMLQGAVLGGGQLPPYEMLADYLFQSLKGQGYLICLDDFHLLENNPLLEKLTERFHAAVLNGDLRLLIAAQRLPDFVLASQHRRLDGLSASDTQTLLMTHAIRLDEPVFHEFYDRTEGNPELLLLTIHLFQGKSEIDTIVQQLVHVEDINRFLLNEIDQTLSDAERETMNGVAVLLGHPGSRDAIEEVLDGHNVRRTLTYLLNRYLLQEFVTVASRMYLQHAIVQDFYYNLLNRRERRAMHQRAARWYESEEIDRYKAALHYYHGEEITKSAQLATQDVWSFINLGYSSALNNLLALYERQQLDIGLWLEVKLAQGQIFAYWGQSEAAKTCYQEILAQTGSYDDTVVRSLCVRAYLGLGELLQLESPQEALTWLQHGLITNNGIDPQQDAGLHIAVGTIHMWLGNYQPAKTELQLGLESLPTAPSQLRVTALENLGVIAIENVGDFEQGIAYTLDALRIARQLCDHFKITQILTTLGSYCFYHGDWSGALANLREALTLSEQIGSERANAFAQITFGSICIDADQGNEEVAKAHLEVGLLLAQKTNQRIDECVALMNLGELNTRLNNLLSADDYLNRAEAMIIQIGNRHYLPIIYSSRAQVNLSMRENDSALTNALKAVSLARELGEEITLGTVLRVLGQSHNALGQYTQAISVFTESAAVLHDKYPFELARTQANWAKSLNACGDIIASTALKQAAEIVFRTLNATRDLATLE